MSSKFSNRRYLNANDWLYNRNFFRIWSMFVFELWISRCVSIFLKLIETHADLNCNSHEKNWHFWIVFNAIFLKFLFLDLIYWWILIDLENYRKWNSDFAENFIFRCSCFRSIDLVDNKMKIVVNSIFISWNYEESNFIVERKYWR